MAPLTRSQRAWRWLFIIGMVPVGIGLYFLGGYLSHRTGVEAWRTAGNTVSLVTMAAFICVQNEFKDLLRDDDWWKWLLGTCGSILLLALGLRLLFTLYPL